MDHSADRSFEVEVATPGHAGTSPAECFAVTSELFFERPDALTAERPALYEQLEPCYRLDLASW